MSHTVVFIHTICGLKPTFEAMLGELTSRASTVHIADETLIRTLLAAGGITDAVRARLREHVLAADRFGARIIQLTCSSISPLAAELAGEVSARLLTIDQPMAEQAVDQFSRIGVTATNPATLEPSSHLIADTAQQRDRAVSVRPALCEGAYEALLSGDTETHDRIVRQTLTGLMAQVDAVVLAQASMARIVETLEPAERTVPVLTSPDPAMRRLAAELEALA